MPTMTPCVVKSAASRCRSPARCSTSPGSAPTCRSPVIPVRRSVASPCCARPQRRPARLLRAEAPGTPASAAGCDDRGLEAEERTVALGRCVDRVELVVVEVPEKADVERGPVVPDRAAQVTDHLPVDHGHAHAGATVARHDAVRVKDVARVLIAVVVLVEGLQKMRSRLQPRAVRWRIGEPVGCLLYTSDAAD